MATGITLNQFYNKKFKLQLETYFKLTRKNESISMTIDTPSDGKIHAYSSDTNIATVKIENNNNITIKTLQYGTTSIYFSQEAGTGYYSNIQPATTLMVITVIPDVGPTINDTSWEIISDVAQSSLGSTIWEIGDKKEITLNGNIGDYFSANNLQLNVFIVHFNLPMNNVQDNNIIFAGFKNNDGINVALKCNMANSTFNGEKSFTMTHWNTSSNYQTYGGWKGCDLRYDILGATSTPPSGYGSIVTSSRIGYDATQDTIDNPVPNTLMAALPNEFRSVLKLWPRWIDTHGYNSINDITEITVDAITLPNLIEVGKEEGGGTNSLGNPFEGQHNIVLTFFKKEQETKAYDEEQNIAYAYLDTNTISDDVTSFFLSSPQAKNKYYISYLRSWQSNPVQVQLASAYYDVQPYKSASIFPLFKI